MKRIMIGSLLLSPYFLILYAEGNWPYFSSGPIEIQMKLEPTDAYEALIAQRVEKLKEDHEKQTFQSEEEKRRAEKSLRNAISRFEKRMRKRLTRHLRGNMARETTYDYLLVAAEQNRNRTADVIRFRTGGWSLGGVQSRFDRGFPNEDILASTYHYVGRVEQEQTNTANGTVTWIVGGVLYARGTFSLRPDVPEPEDAQGEQP